MIYLLRHCESLYNVSCREGKEDDYKEYDSPLSSHGKESAKKLAHSIIFDMVYVSPLQRCLDTLQFSNIRYKESIILPLIREMKSHVSDFFKGEDICLEKQDKVLERISTFKKMLEERDKSKNLLIVGHADFFWYLTSFVEEDGERFHEFIFLEKAI